MATILFIALLSGGLSLFGALLAERLLTERIALLGSFIGLQISHNPGVAFGVSFAPFVQMTLILIALAAVLWMARSVRSSIQQIAYGLILGGGVGNIIDRLFDGLVTDYFQVGTFPIFNLADSCITVGVGILLLQLVLKRKV